MAKALSAAFKRQTSRLVKAVDNAKQIREQGGFKTKTVKVYNTGWKTALRQGFGLADRGVSNISLKKNGKAKKRKR